jgi:CheY-like chemotaxis protein
MPDGGRLTIRADNVREQELDGAGDGHGRYVLIEVADTGCGMPAKVIERAFEPFFTTKPTGQGTGLGLSMAYGFVKQTGGEILLDSEPGRGTTVRIFLPPCAEHEEQQQPAGAQPPLVGGSETILVVEDEPDVRQTAVELLEALGYRVLSAEDAGSAIDLIEGGARVDLVFSDVVMPGKRTSFDLSEVVRERLPGTPVLFTSGYAEGVIAHKGKVAPSVNLLPKPYQATVLAARIRQLLAQRQGAKSAQPA